MSIFWSNRIADLRWGLWYGSRFALAFAIIGTVLTVANGGRLPSGETYSLWAMLASYIGGGIAGGSVVGLLRPLTKTRFGAGFVGALVGIVVYTVVAVALFGMPTSWDGAAWTAALLPGPFVGFPVGWMMRSRHPAEDEITPGAQ